VQYWYGSSAATDRLYDATDFGDASRLLGLMPPPHVPEKMSEVDVLDTAKILLKHFRDIVIPQFAPFPIVSKSPWEILVWSAAVRTHADMSFLHSPGIRSANKANLFAVLACSAYHITKTQFDGDSLSPAQVEHVLDYAAQRAKKYLQESLKLETCGPQKAKYKDQLIAIFSLTAFAV
jgi:arginine metabolism regulation protein II